MDMKKGGRDHCKVHACVTKGRYNVKCPQLSTRGGEGVKIGLNLVQKKTTKRGSKIADFETT